MGLHDDGDARGSLMAAAHAAGIDLAALAAHTPSVLHRKDTDETEVDWRIARNEKLFRNPKMIPADFADAQVTDERVQRWLDGHAQNPREYKLLLLQGTKGTGKTTNLIGALKWLVNHSARTGTTPDEKSPGWLHISDSQAEWEMRDFRGDHARELMEKMLSVKFLAFSDLGTAVSKEYRQSWLYHLVDHRWANGLVTLYDSNVPLTEFGSEGGNPNPLIDDRVASRLLSGHIIIMNGEDYRARTRGVIR